jgi:hypothetical protein
MSFKKKIMAVVAVGALTVGTAVPAMALENEFHGMFKFFGYEGNFFDGGSAQPALKKDAHSGFFAEQRARINYIAKANDNLKLVTHFELDSRFGGLQTNSPGTGATGTGTVNGYKGSYTGNDSGQLDADSVTLETKSVYLDYNCPITGANVKAGIQPWADSYPSLFLLADMTGVIAAKKFDPLTVSLGWFRFDDKDAFRTNSIGRITSDLIVLDGKFAISKDIVLGASYYNVQNDSSLPTENFELLHMIGLNADVKAGPVTVKPFFAYQFGDAKPTGTVTNDISAFLAGATAKVKVGPGSINATAVYLSGDDNGTGKNDDFKTIAPGTTYLNAANMWLLVRNGQATNSSISVTGNDLTVGGRGLVGFFAGYEGTFDKLFFNANVGYAMTAEERTNAGVKEDGSIGTEINAQIGYKLFDNLSISTAAAYAFLGDGMNSTTIGKRVGGAADADDPYMFNVQLAYAF